MGKRQRAMADDSTSQGSDRTDRTPERVSGKSGTNTVVERRPRGGNLYSLDELMAETTVLTEERREREERELEELDKAQALAAAQAEMVAPELIMPERPPADLPSRDGAESERAGGRLRGTLVITLQGRHQIKYPIYKDEITIGRSKENDIQINSEYVSRVHARILTTDAGVVIEDASSKNGILVASNSVQRYVFQDGDIVVLGTTRITYLA